MSSKTVEEIKERLGILELIESYIKVEKAGSSFRALCPFHNEKTPSFHISPDRGSYYCFGCSAKGDIFTFVQEFEGLDFLSALKLLAERTGITISYDKLDESVSEKEVLFKILEKTTLYLEQNLEKNDAVKQYLENRGVNSKTIKNWRLGYVPDGWSNIYDYLKKENFKAEDIEKAGLIKRKDSSVNGKLDDGYYDRFRERIMFPIFDASSRVVGFSGRTLKKDNDREAKYINSPETLLFSKSNILFGYNFAKQSIRKNNFSILVEGQFDVVLSHQAGYINTVATSGTALTEYQIDLLSRLSNRLVIAMDGDGAGFRASQRAWEMALEKGIDVKIAIMTSKEDPADIIKRDPESWKESIKGAVHIIDFLIQKIQTDHHSDERVLKKSISLVVIPYIYLLPSKLEQSHFVKRISEIFSIAEDIVWQEVSAYVPESDVSKFKLKDKLEEENEKETEVTHDRFAVVKDLLGIVSWQERQKEPKINTKEIQDRIIKLVGEKNVKRILESSHTEELIFKTERTYSFVDNLEKAVKELLITLQKKLLEYKRSRLHKELIQAESIGDAVKEKELLENISIISKEIENIVTSDYK